MKKYRVFIGHEVEVEFPDEGQIETFLDFDGARKARGMTLAEAAAYLAIWVGVHHERLSGLDGFADLPEDAVKTNVRYVESYIENERHTEVE